MGNRVEQSKRDQIAARYREGVSSTRVGREFGVSHRTVLNVLQEQGIAARGVGAHRRYSIDERFFEHIDSEEKAYFLGFIAADGALLGPHDRPSTVSIGIGETDIEILHGMVQCIGDYPIRVYQRPCVKANGETVNRKSAVLSIYSVKMAQDLISHGVVPAKSFTLEAWDGPSNLMRHYWRGMFDGDGCIAHRVYKEKHVFNVQFCGSAPVVTAFMQYASGICDGVTAGALRKDRNIWAVVIHGRHRQRLLMENLYKDASICLSRKKALVEMLLSDEFKPTQGAYLKPATVRQEYESGISGLSLSAKYGVSIPCIYDKVKKAGGKMRSQSTAAKGRRARVHALEEY